MCLGQGLGNERQYSSVQGCQIVQNIANWATFQSSQWPHMGSGHYRVHFGLSME